MAKLEYEFSSRDRPKDAERALDKACIYSVYEMGTTTDYNGKVGELTWIIKIKIIQYGQN